MYVCCWQGYIYLSCIYICLLLLHVGQIRTPSGESSSSRHGSVFCEVQ